MTFSIRSLFLFLFISVIGLSNAQNSSLILELRNIEILQGNLFVSLTSDSLQFANFVNPTETNIQKATVKSSSEFFTFQNIKPGWYAIAVFQDLNGNDSLDKKKFGIPAEPFGFSNNALAKFRPPWFKQAQFYIDDNKEVTQIIDLVYRKPKKRSKTDSKK